METVQLQRSAESTDVTLYIANSAGIWLIGQHVSRSPVLCNVLAVGDKASFAAPQGYLRAWLELLQQNALHMLERMNISRLLVFLKASDFLADEDAVNSICKELGQRLFRGNQQLVETSEATQSLSESSAAVTVLEAGLSSFSSYSGVHASAGPIGSVRSCSFQVLENVPSHLGISILQASDSDIFDCLKKLPEAYHGLALCAHFPQITHTHCCYLEHKSPYNPPSSANLQALFETVSKFKNLMELHMGIVGQLPDAYGPLARAFDRTLTECDHLQSVVIGADHRSQGFLTAQIARVLSVKLPTLTHLKRLNLHACAEFMDEWTDEQRHPGSVRSVAYRDLFEAICRCSHLEDLSLTMKIMHDGSSSDRDFFVASNVSNFPSSLRVLKLRGPVSGDSLKALDSRLSDSLNGKPNIKWLPKLQELDIGRSFLGDHGIRALVPILTRLDTLKALDVSENEVTAAGAEILAPVLKSLTYLSRINVRDNRLEDSGLVALCRAWNCLKGLQHLDVSYCDVSIEGSMVLARTLGGLSCLQYLHMKGCKLSRRLWDREHDRKGDCMGAKALAEALGAHTHLRSLSLVC